MTQTFLIPKIRRLAIGLYSAQSLPLPFFSSAVWRCTLGEAAVGRSQSPQEIRAQ